MRVRTALDLGALIRERRRELGLNQQALAERIGASRLWVSQVEQGKPTAEVGLVLRALAAVGVDLRVDVGTLSGDSDAPGAHRTSVDIDDIVERARK